MRSRCSKQRTAIERAVCESREHPTARQVFELVRQQLPSVSLGTVYRNLMRLVADGQLRSVHTGDLPLRFEGVLNEHGHFVCRSCGRIFDLSEDAGIGASSQLVAAGFRVERTAITLHGRCPGCVAKG